MLSPALDDSYEKLVAHGRDFRRRHAGFGGQRGRHRNYSDGFHWAINYRVGRSGAAALSSLSL